MKANLTDITVVLDRSGSMQSVWDDTIGGFNTFLQGQKDADGEATLTLVQFDHEYNVVYDNINIQDVVPLNRETYVPRGNTALLDAIGRSVVTTGERLKNTPEEDRPSNIVFVILTDGFENGSREYQRSQINEMIKHQTDTYNWDFVFLAANQDAIATGSSLGFGAGNSMSFASNSVGTKAVYDTISASMANLRGGDLSYKTEFFKQSDRDAQPLSN